MRLPTLRPLLVVIAAAGLASCTAPADSSDSASPAPTASTSASQPTAGPSGAPAPDTETTDPAPSPSAPGAPPSGPGAGNAELAIMLKPSSSEPAVNYTLVCQNGLPTAESKHPTPEAACAALKTNAALLSPAATGTAQVCTEQYGGPEQATVTGAVDDTPVDATFARTNGCEISAWNAAQDVLGASGGAA